MICEAADDKANIEELRNRTDVAHVGSSSMDERINQQTADMEQAEARLRAREKIYTDNEKTLRR